MCAHALRLLASQRMMANPTRRALSLTSLAALASACDAPPIFDPRAFTLCRAHSGEVLQFKWRDAWRTLPIEPPLSETEDGAWRARLYLPARSRSPDPRLWQSRPISTVARLGNGWLVGTDLGEWGGDLMFVKPGAPPSRFSSMPVRAMLPLRNGLVVLCGSIVLDEGYYVIASSLGDGLTLSEARTLPGAPVDIARDGAVTFVAGGFSERRHKRTWAFAFVDGEFERAIVHSPC